MSVASTVSTRRSREGTLEGQLEPADVETDKQMDSPKMESLKVMEENRGLAVPKKTTEETTNANNVCEE